VCVCTYECVCQIVCHGWIELLKVDFFSFAKRFSNSKLVVKSEKLLLRACVKLEIVICNEVQKKKLKEY
jgi:hypothetical protein